MLQNERKDLWIGIALVALPLVFIIALISTFSKVPDFWMNTLWIVQPLMIIGMPIGIGKLVYRWAVAKQKKQIEKYAKRISYITAAVLCMVYIVPQIFQMAREEIQKLSPITKEQISPILQNHYSQIYNNPKITEIHTIFPKNGDWIASFDLCETKNAKQTCLPLKALINSDNQVIASDMDFGRMRHKLEALTDQKPQSQ